jgi:predicted RNA-binding protein with RPS1 domain
MIKRVILILSLLFVSSTLTASELRDQFVADVSEKLVLDAEQIALVNQLLDKEEKSRKILLKKFRINPKKPNWKRVKKRDWPELLKGFERITNNTLNDLKDQLSEQQFTDYKAIQDKYKKIVAEMMKG